MSSKIPKAGLASESSVDEDIESADAEKGRIALSSGEDVESGMTESDVANDVGWLQEMIQRHRRQNVRNVADKRVERLLAGFAAVQSAVRIDGYLRQKKKKTEP